MPSSVEAYAWRPMSRCPTQPGLLVVSLKEGHRAEIDHLRLNVTNEEPNSHQSSRQDQLDAQFLGEIGTYHQHALLGGAHSFEEVRGSRCHPRVTHGFQALVQ